jgi:hypothetical protein
MSKRYPGGLITKTPVTPTTASAPGVWTLEQALQYIKAGTWPLAALTDPYFKYVTMLLHGDGTNGAQNNTFLDSSTNNFTITRNGNTTQGSFSPYGSNWSNYFDGTGDSLTIPNNTAFRIGSGDFTVEGWVLFPTAGGIQAIVSQFNSGGTGPGWTIYKKTTDVIEFFGGSGTITVTGTTALTVGAWNHFAVVRNGSTITIYVNGVAGGTGTNSSFTDETTTALYIGARADGAPMTGYISNVRIVKGTAVYTSAFTPSTTPLTAIANTSLLTCQSNRFIDNSTNNFTITRNGDVSVQRFSPFSPTAAYSTSVIGGSGYFDGSGDKLTLANSSAFDCGTGNDFCMEMWAYATYYTNAQHYWTSHQGGVTNGFYFSNATGAGRYPSLQIYSGGGGGAGVASNVLMPLNQWNHICVTRQSGRMRIFLNGELTGTTTTSFQVNTDGHLLGINGGDNFNGDGGWYGGGRYINGSVPTTYQTASTTLNTQIFTPPTAPFTTTSQGAVAGDVKVLVTFTNGGIFDNAMMNNLETVGDAQISTSVKKFGTGSMAFDGSGDYLISANNPNISIASGDFTIEFWLYWNSVTNQADIVSSRPNTSAQTGYVIYLGTNYFAFVMSSNGSSWDFNQTTSFTWSSGTWYHCAVTRSGSNIRFFVNGTQVGNTYTYLNSIAQTNPLVVGGSPGGNYLNGYIDDLRITKGYARYTSTFTPPAAAFPNQ